MPDEATRFLACLGEVLRHEGGYADHPKDPGGATNLGITIKTLADWRGVSPWWSIGKAAVKALTRDEAGSIYRKRYWDTIEGDSLPAGLDLAVFDFAVNSGPGRAIKALQRELRVTADGNLGPVTIEALNARIAAGGSAALVAALCGGRLGFLKSLATFSTFGRGWSRRVEEVRRAALTMAGADPAQPSPNVDNPWRQKMDFLTGYRTYIVAGVMLLAGVAQLLGIDLPALNTQSAGQMMMEALAIIFLRRGIKGDISKA
jgi:lysozyme family protein